MRVWIKPFFLPKLYFFILDNVKQLQRLARSRFIDDEAEEDDSNYSNLGIPVNKKLKQIITSTPTKNQTTLQQVIQSDSTLNFFLNTGIITLIDEGSH